MDESRVASGVRNAEMKWTRPGKLSAYGVALLGWPSEIEYKNPSKMSFQETSTIMRLLQENTIYFRLLQDHTGTNTSCSSAIVPSIDTNDVSWACDVDGFHFGAHDGIPGNRA